MGVKDWKWIVKSTIYREAFWELKAECYSNKKTIHITYKHFGTSDYLLKLSPELVCLVFKAKTRMFDIKSKANTNLQNSKIAKNAEISIFILKKFLHFFYYILS